MSDKVTTVEKLADAVSEGFKDVHREITRHRNENMENFKSLGDHLITIEDRLEKLSDLHRLDEKVERMRTVLREKLGVEV
jgi:hypothetical protein